MKGRSTLAERDHSVAGGESKDTGIAKLEEEFGSDHIPFIDYSCKEDAIFGNLGLDEEESMDNELDITKIYENELELSENELRKVNAFEKEFNLRPLLSDSTLFGKHTEQEMKPHLRLDLNSDVGNDICLENIRKIHKYLDEDAKTEKAFEEEISKTLRYMKLPEHPE
ncbi:hypothetical protein NECID01_0267 [Nematocida sp. AWRm77]|nr:hypothetical protein NECID01_0267 [Nematocida sp. AWRm77]